ncbi:hypothetical protein HPP92_000329 [Vanilla planifolia]|uniref:Neprosin PEP catalytic domain-containing protein n=1 Tax=Vanilla planifolia TaxID=51239 RepID=A0A835VIL9_VANPL|nr:hypothetical protein HPP92_000329 [Vanilla planifolia]
MVLVKESLTPRSSSWMASRCPKHQPIIAFFVIFLAVISASAAVSTDKRIAARVQRLNKPSNKTIQSPDGDLIDCVPWHLQPAFDHPKLRGQNPMRPPERPRGEDTSSKPAVEMQTWRNTGEDCPEGTVPIRRTTEQDVLRASSLRIFGKKPAVTTRRNSAAGNHEHAVGFANGEFFGAKASLSVWNPSVSVSAEFSLSQIWLISGSFARDLNTIEAGWMVSPRLYGDTHPRFFTYWTSDSYERTGCYNLLCSGFVQISSKVAVGASISPTSVYGRRQFDITLLVWKDPKFGNWWLELGSGELVGYWPSCLFSHLAGGAKMVQFGGEIVNTRPSGSHTSTQMGSGHFAAEGFGRAAYFRNVEVVDWENSLVPLSGIRVLADHPTCYDVGTGVNRVLGIYVYYGGPGRNTMCP